MLELKGREFVEAFLAHPNPIIYSRCPSIPEICSAVVPQENGSFNNKSPRMGLGSEVSYQKLQLLETLETYGIVGMKLGQEDFGAVLIDKT